jgi:predicted MPP superfamily phosphohydrolase
METVTGETIKTGVSRRTVLKRMAWGGMAACAVGTAYGVAEAGWITVERREISIPRLPQPFLGTVIVFLTDIHHGPFISLAYVEQIVDLANSLSPDLICLGGDYVYMSGRYIRPCIEALAGLNAPMGVYGVLGNHDHYHDPALTVRLMAESGIRDLSNKGVWLECRGERLRLGGVDDLWTSNQDIHAAVGNTSAIEACILLSHNPDFAETITDPRVGLVLSGHTHGGQIYLPYVPRPWYPSAYGSKYLRGLVQAPQTQVMISRGLGLVKLPVRIGSPPELSVITLV